MELLLARCYSTWTLTRMLLLGFYLLFCRNDAPSRDRNSGFFQQGVSVQLTQTLHGWLLISVKSICSSWECVNMNYVIGQLGHGEKSYSSPCFLKTVSDLLASHCRAACCALYNLKSELKDDKATGFDKVVNVFRRSLYLFCSLLSCLNSCFHLAVFRVVVLRM